MVSKTLIDSKQKIGEHYVAVIKLLSVQKSSSRPDGFKLNCALIDIRLQKPVLILDNHKPFGYHVHPDPINDHKNRVIDVARNPLDAIDIF